MSRVFAHQTRGVYEEMVTLPCNGDVAIPLRARMAFPTVFRLSLAPLTIDDSSVAIIFRITIHARCLEIRTSVPRVQDMQALQMMTGAAQARRYYILA